MTLPILRRTEPTKSLFDPSEETRLEYVPAAQCDIRARFEAIKAELAAKAVGNVQPLKRKRAGNV